MPKGIPSDGVHWTQRQITKADLLARRKEFLADMDARIKQMERREKALSDLKKWLASRKLNHFDLGWIYRQMAPKRAAAPVKSKKPLQPQKGNLGKKLDGLDAGFVEDGKHYLPRGNKEFRHAIYKARIEKGLSAAAIGEKLGISGSGITAWEKGRYIPSEEKRAKLVKFLGLPADLGQATSLAMEAEHPSRRGNSASE